jgi:hypothetical protein
MCFALVVCLIHAGIAEAADCASCHPAEAKAQALTAHASALVRADKSVFAANLPDHALAEAANGYMFTYRRSPVGVLATATRGNDSAQGLMEWVFGSGKRGQTPVVSFQGKYLEHRVSFYTETGKYGITTGQENGVSASAAKALGRTQTDADLKSCFGCHSTGSMIDPATFIPGVQCARCHAGAEEHASGHGKPVNPGKLDHAAQLQLCGTCHRTTPQPGNDDPVVNVRFQPLRLMKSRCYLEGQIACTTCHVAHVDARRDDPAFYNGKCAACHAREEQHIARQGSANCIGCHMPRSRPDPALEFTDHFIRVVSK